MSEIQPKYVGEYVKKKVQKISILNVFIQKSSKNFYSQLRVSVFVVSAAYSAEKNNALYAYN